MKIILIFLLFYAVLIKSQSFKLGFDIEAHQIRISDQYGEKEILGGNGLPISIHFITTYNPISKIAIQSKIGRTLHSEFFGWEFGINGYYKFYKPFYISGGILQHSNEGGVVSNQLYISYASLLMLKAGFGIDIFKTFSIEVDYYVPTQKKVIIKSGIAKRFSEKIENMFRLSFIWAWEI